MSIALEGQRVRRLVVLSLVALALVASACAGSDSGPASVEDQGKPAPVRELTSIETLREAFNDDAGSIRLILLISPT